MATYSVSCVGAKLTLDTDQQTVTIQRDPNVLMALPAETVLPVSTLEKAEHKFQDFGYGHGTGMIKFLYPGCPAGGDILLGHTTHENIVQYKGRAANDAKAFLDALNALLKAARSAGWSPYIYCAYRPYLTQKQQYEDQVSAYMREGDTRDEAETAAARVAAPPGTSDHQTGLGADVVDQYYDSLSVDKVNARFLSWLADNCADYGFVIRYPSDKVSITGRNEPWHVRYVGETAAKFMTEHNLCLEEFAALYQ